MKTSDLLKRAEDYLWDGTKLSLHKSDNLCGAIVLASSNKSFHARVASRKARRAIMKALGDCVFYHRWAVQNGHLPLNWYAKQKKWFPILQTNRLNWLRELQRQFKAKGD